MALDLLKTGKCKIQVETKIREKTNGLERRFIMKQFSEADRKYIVPIVEEINSAESIREGMITAYTNHLPDKERNQGELMTERAFRGIENFYKELEEALKDTDGWLTRSVDKLGEGMEITERCGLYRDKIIQFADAARSVLPEDKVDAVIKAAEDLYTPGQEVTEGIEAALKTLLKDLIAEDASLAQKMTELMIEYAEKNEDIELEYNETQEKGLLAAMIMAAYIAAKEGNVEEIPSDVTLDEVTVLVCSMYESSKVVQQAEKGNISWAVAKTILEVIGIVAMAKLLVCATELSFLMLTMVFGTVMSGLLTAVLFLTLGYWMVNHGVILLDKGVDVFVEKIIGGVIEDVKSVISFSAAVLKGAARTVKGILAWAVEKASAFMGKSKKETEAQTVEVKNTAERETVAEDRKTAETLTEEEREMFYEEDSFVTE